MLNDWYASPVGEYVLTWEQKQVDEIVADIFGFNAVQVGLPTLDFLRANRMPLRACLSPMAGAAVLAEPEQLPLASSSVDLLVLPHTLEFSQDPHQILREAERVLMPEGHVLVVGFNPLSLWGLRARWARRSGVAPWNGQFLSVLRLKDWFKLLGFEVRAGAFGCYVPPVESADWLRRWRFLDAAGDRWWPIAGGVYILQAVKRTPGMRLVRPNWRERAKPQKSLAPAVGRETVHRQHPWDPGSN